MGRLVIKRLKAIVSCDANDTVYENADMLIEDNKIAYIGDMTDGIHDMLPRAYKHAPSFLSVFFAQPAAGAEHGTVRLAKDPL